MKPHYMRPPNRFLHYRVGYFNNGQQEAFLRVAVYLDKAGRRHEDIAQVKWIN